jgi:hypothetical protein
MVSAVLADAAVVYRRLWRRSVVVAGLVFAVIGLADALASRSATVGTTFVSLLLALVGGLLVQGALVEVVRDLHESRQPVGTAEYLHRTRGRLGTLLGAALLYGLGVVIGFVLLVVPGLVAVARWSLVVPLVMIEELDVRAAFGRSWELVRGRTGPVLVVVLVANLLASIAGALITVGLGFLPAFLAIWLGGAVAGAVAVPYEAHVLTVLYYRLTEPGTPVLPGAADRVPRPPE